MELDFTEHFTSSQFCTKIKSYRRSVEFDVPYGSVCDPILSQIVKFDGL